jgi:hypothetical protein
MDSTSKTTCFRNTSATDCGSFEFGFVRGVPLQPGDRLTVVPFMVVICTLRIMHASGANYTCLLGWGEAPLVS